MTLKIDRLKINGPTVGEMERLKQRETKGVLPD